MISQLKEQLATTCERPELERVGGSIFRKQQQSQSIVHLKDRQPIPAVLVTAPTDLKVSKQQLSTEKAKAFELFKQSYPPSEWIDGQKKLLKTKYNDAKKLGEAAHSLRNQMSTFY
jgi:hypothetical protein